MIGADVEVHVDNMVVKSTSIADHYKALGRVFQILRKHQLKMNPENCSFGVQVGKFLGFMLTERGIEANPEKCQAIINMRNPKTVKEVQQLTERTTTLSWFLSRSAETTAPIFNTLKKGDTFVWMAESEEVFLRLKEMLATLPDIDEANTRNPPRNIHFGSGKSNECSDEKAVLTLVIASRRLRPYFQGHLVIVRTNLPIKQVLKKSDLTGKMIAWSVQLSEFDILYESKGHIKAQALADFVTKMMAGSLEVETSGGWLLSVDEASNQAGSGAGANNNQAEYEALLAGMRLAKELGAKVLTAKSDSKLMTRDPQLVRYLDKTTKLAAAFEKFTFHHVPREQNERADQLSRLAPSQKRGVQKSIIYESISRPTIEEPDVGCVEEQTTWMSPLMAYSRDEIKPEDPAKAKKLIKEAAIYIIIGGELYKSEARYMIREVHERLCGSHIKGRELASKIAKAGYYWPTLKGDCMDYVRRCNKCQRFIEVGNTAPKQLHVITSPWSFHKWGEDILGPFPPSPRQVKFLIVAVDYFTKWIEVEIVTTISAKKIKHFYRKKIIGRFGLPTEIVLDNGTQLASRAMTNFCAQLKIKQCFTSVEHPQTNGQAEVANKVILRGLRRQLEEVKGR
ncbi:Retrovirus-related Pol polyprotein from transposon 17.6, partial [Mucuna pruriens]